MCRVRKLVRLKNLGELMVKLNNKKVKYIIDFKIKDIHSTKELSEIYNTSKKWIQIIIKKFNETGKYPKLNRNRRPKTYLTDEQKRLIYSI